jgi:hypothetical protein
MQWLTGHVSSRQALEKDLEQSKQLSNGAAARIKQAQDEAERLRDELQTLKGEVPRRYG